MKPPICLTHIGGGGSDGHDMAPWVVKDAEILESSFDVRPFRYDSTMQVPSLAVALLSAQASLNWFAWDNAFWAVTLGRLLSVPSVVILGGFDAANEPEFRYGALSTSEGVKRLRRILKGATRVFAISKFLTESAQAVVPAAKIEVLYLGFNPEEFPPGPPSEGRRAICTVGDLSSQNLQRKGIADFLDVAREIPEVPFLVAGRVHPSAKTVVQNAPSNVEFLGFVSQERLLNVYHSSRVYLQLSRHEGFGCSVAEAMLCRCTPVVTKAGALPEVVGDTGTYVSSYDPREIAESVRKTFEDQSAPDAPRKRIMSNFSLRKRADILRHAITEVCEDWRRD